MPNKRHKACAVAIDDHLVITGGTMLGLSKVKPAWMAELGIRTAEKFDGTTWTRLPSMNRAKVKFTKIYLGTYIKVSEGFFLISLSRLNMVAV